MNTDRKLFRLTMPSADVAAFLGECVSAEWYAFDTGERVMTDEGPDAEAILLVEPAVRVTEHVAMPLMA